MHDTENEEFGFIAIKENYDPTILYVFELSIIIPVILPVFNVEDNCSYTHE